MGYSPDQVIPFTPNVEDSILTPSSVVIQSPTPQSSSQLMRSASAQALSLEPQPISSIKPGSSSDPSYHKTPRVIKLIHVELEWWDQNPQTTARQILGPAANFLHKTPKHTQKFYELILVDSHSVSIHPHKDKKTGTIVTNTSVQIHSILTPTHWNSLPNSLKRFSIPFDSLHFTYWDYQEAWINTFTFQNQYQNHSWFFSFNKSKPVPTFPHWFINQWWPSYGPTEDILPTPVKEGFNYFKSRFYQPHPFRGSATHPIFQQL